MKLINLSALLMLVPFIAGCSSCANDWKHFKSQTIGIYQHITLYDANGQVIRQWVTQHPVELKGGDAAFIDATGNAVTVAGTFVIEEKASK